MKQKVLVVDDEPDVRSLCKINLEYDGFDVIEAVDGEDALEVLKTERPDLILLDIMMPKLDGWAVLATIKHDPSTSAIPVIMLTAKVDEASQLKGWESGVVDYMTKPFSPLSLTKFVKRALSQDPDEQSRRRKNITDGLRRLQDIRAQDEQEENGGT